MALSDTQIRALLIACRETHPDELTCEEFLDRMAAFAEARAAGRAAPETQAEAHERLCGNCREELAALVEMLRAGVLEAG